MARVTLEVGALVVGVAGSVRGPAAGAGLGGDPGGGGHGSAAGHRALARVRRRRRLARGTGSRSSCSRYRSRCSSTRSASSVRSPRRSAPHRHLRLALWCLAGAVTVLFNLDAAVVLLTPLYVRIRAATATTSSRSRSSPRCSLRWRRRSFRCRPHQPRAGRSTAPRGRRLPRARGSGRPSRRRSSAGSHIAVPPASSRPASRRPRSSTGTRCELARRSSRSFCSASQLVTHSAFPAWVVAGLALTFLSAPEQQLPWRHVPLAAVALALTLGTLTLGAAQAINVDRVLSVNDRAPGQALTFGATVIGEAVNNLPAVLVALPQVSVRIPTRSGRSCSAPTSARRSGSRARCRRCCGSRR